MQLFTTCHSTKEERCLELNTLTNFDKHVNFKGLASSKY